MICCCEKDKIPPITTNKTIHLPDDIIDRLEAEIQGKNRAFSAFVVAAVKKALEDPHENEDKK